MYSANLHIHLLVINVYKLLLASILPLFCDLLFCYLCLCQFLYSIGIHIYMCIQGIIRVLICPFAENFYVVIPYTARCSYLYLTNYIDIDRRVNISLIMFDFIQISTGTF